ncbi:UNVERIFIED_CONTAM: hypothetical protein Scaly_2652000 [Sesamum calycinum]|uniref:Uncharacterized protein n=1 Tax=Sesamum calycinum TaxID=2727403 RepID=A0AAW2J8H3_9LAMI
MAAEHSESSPLMAPTPIADPSEIDLEAGPDEQIQCRICLETDVLDCGNLCAALVNSRTQFLEPLPVLEHRYFGLIYVKHNGFRLSTLVFDQEGFAFAHCTTCKAPYYMRVHAVADRKWRTLKFRFFVTRDILFIFFSVQLVIALLSYLVYLIDAYQKFWLRLTWGFDSELSFYYICVYVPIAICLALFVCGPIVPHALKVVPVQLANVVAWEEYVVEDVDAEMAGADWSPPPLPHEHVQQLKALGLL